MRWWKAYLILVVYSGVLQCFGRDLRKSGCERLIKKASEGEKMNCTGIGSRYAAISKLEVKINTEMKDINQSAGKILMMLAMKGLL